MWGASFKGCVVKKPVDNLTLSAEDGEALIARVHQQFASSGRGTVEWVIRMYFHVVFALQGHHQHAAASVLALWQEPRAIALAGGSFAPSQADGDGQASCRARSRCGDRGDGESSAAWGVAEAGAGQAQGRTPPGDGSPGSRAYAGATRVECRHEELAVGQRCPVCGQGNLYALPAGVEIRIDGNALLSAMHYELEKLRCSACGEIFTAGCRCG